MTRIRFEGSFIEYFVISLALLVLSAVTFGLALPYYAFWSLKYFFTKLRVGDQRIVFAGSFGEYFVTALGLLVLSVLTLGLLLPYYAYWSFKYFFTRLELAPSTASDAQRRHDPTPVRTEEPARRTERVTPAVASRGLPSKEPAAPPSPDAAAEATRTPPPQTYQFRSPG